MENMCQEPAKEKPGEENPRKRNQLLPRLFVGCGLGAPEGK